MQSRFLNLLPVAAAAVAALPASVAHAYVGPGAGISAIGTLIVLLAAILLAIAGFIWYPIKRLLRYRRPIVPKPAADPTPPNREF